MKLREILAEADLEVLMSLAEEIASWHNVRIIQSPETCTAMLQAMDSVGCVPFYVGEVLMSEAAVEINGVNGYGFALEDEPERAICIAIVDAALAAEVEQIEYIRQAIAAEEKRIAIHRQQEINLVAATKVNFAIMEG